ncbi:transmembrane protein 18-like [Rhopilema esculentum]|uniref:transmembrane protein 18-like n=1 Tax=Rhopilema esculentum TaxID=499914 RepID=UPI0031D506AB
MGLEDGTFWIKEKQITDLWDFISVINWRENWLLALLVFHFICLIGILCTRKHTNIQLAIFCCLCALALSSQKINELAAKYWKAFAKEQYFDSHGLFIMVTFSGPIMFNCLVLVIIWLLEAGKLLIKTKRRQLLIVKDAPNEKLREKDKDD